MEGSVLSGYWVWNHDSEVHGPLSYQELVRQIKKRQAGPGSWIYREEVELWQRAGKLPELKKLFGEQREGTSSFGRDRAPDPPIARDRLRQVKIFAGMDDDQLDRIARYMEAERVPGQTVIVSQGDPADAMYIVLEGEVRIRLMIAGKETLLTRLSAGDFFGEMALIDRGARSADVVTNSDTLLAKIKSSVFQKLVKDIPELVMPLVWNIGKTLTSRIRADNKRYLDATNFARVREI